MQSRQKQFSLAEHLKGFSAVNVGPEVTLDINRKWLQQYGPVTQTEFATFNEALAYLLPIKSFTTRFLVLGLNGWSLLLTDKHGEFCYVDAYALSRATGCNGIGVIWQDERRELHVYEEGKPLRKIQSLLDGDRWYYREAGPLQPFEDAAECLRKRKTDRLSTDAVKRYFQTYTGLTIPDWKNAAFTKLFGLERTTKDMRVPIVRFETMNDL